MIARPNPSRYFLSLAICSIFNFPCIRISDTFSSPCHGGRPLGAVIQRFLRHAGCRLRRERLHAIPVPAKREKTLLDRLPAPCCFPPANRSPRTVFLIGKAQPPYFRHVNIINQQEMVFWSGWVSVPPFPYQHLEHRRRSCSVLSASSGKRKTPDFVGDRASYPAPMCPSRKRKTPDFVGDRASYPAPIAHRGKEKLPTSLEIGSLLLWVSRQRGARSFLTIDDTIYAQ